MGSRRFTLLRARRFLRGVTLLELMVVVVIIGILAAIAYPNYREFVIRSKRNEAKAALLQIATNQERFYLQNGTFTTNLLLLGFSTDPFTTGSNSYLVSVTGAGTADFTAVADYIPTDAETARCNVFQISANGVRISTPDTDCWTRNR